MSCQFHPVNTGGPNDCDATIRLYKTWSSGDESIQPIPGANHLIVACNGEVLYTMEAQVLRIGHEDGVHWEVRGVSGNITDTPLIDLGTDPFSAESYPKSQESQLEFPDRQLLSGSCDIELNRAF